MYIYIHVYMCIYTCIHICMYTLYTCIHVHYDYVSASSWETVRAFLLFVGAGWGDNVQWQLPTMVMLCCKIFHIVFQTVAYTQPSHRRHSSCDVKIQKSRRLQMIFLKCPMFSLFRYSETHIRPKMDILRGHHFMKNTMLKD